MTTDTPLPPLPHDPFKIDSPTCISFSGGRTSAYMLWCVLQANGGLPDEAVVCFANTGKEEEATLEFVRDCGERWNVPITWVEYRNDEQGFAVVNFDTASRDGEPFEALIRKKRFLPNPIARFCTEELKVKAIEKVIPKDSEMMIGVRSDEPLRVAKMRLRGLLVPLADADVTQADVQAFWREQPFDLGLTYRDGLTVLGNCDLCFLKGPRHIMALVQSDPGRAVWWAMQENYVGAVFRSDRPSYAAMLANSQNQIDFIGHEEEGIPCFCGD